MHRLTRRSAVASPVNFDPKDNANDLLLPALNGTVNVLSSAVKLPTVKRVVITATMATMSHIGSGPIPGKIYDVILRLFPLWGHRVQVLR